MAENNETTPSPDEGKKDEAQNPAPKQPIQPPKPEPLPTAPAKVPEPVEAVKIPPEVTNPALQAGVKTGAFTALEAIDLQKKLDAAVPVTKPVEAPAAAPSITPEMKKSLQDAGLLPKDTAPESTLQTMKGSEADSYFLVVAKAKSLRLGMRPLVFPIQDGKKLFLMLGFRLRVETAAPDGSVLMADEAFGLKGFNAKGAHASMVGGIKMAEMPASQQEMYKVFTENLLTQVLVGDLLKRLEDQKAELLATPDQMVEYLNLAYASSFPNVIPETIKEFPVIYGVKQKQPKIKKAPDPGAGGDDHI